MYEPLQKNFLLVKENFEMTVVSFPWRDLFIELVNNFLTLMCLFFQLSDFFENLFEITFTLGERKLKLFRITLLFLQLLFLQSFSWSRSSLSWAS